MAALAITLYNEVILKLVVILPALCRCGTYEESLSERIVNNALGFAVELEGGVEPLGDDTEGHGLGERASDLERAAGLLLAHA